jgi:hypothetical protein
MPSPPSGWVPNANFSGISRSSSGYALSRDGAR